MTEYIPHKPTPKQHAFLLLDCLEALYGGAAGGGKSDALLMAALQYVDVPGYSALLLRRTYADLSLPGAIMDRAGEWLRPTAADWSERDKTWTFPSGARLTFGYLATENDKYRYQGAEFQFIGSDELTQFTSSMYTYLFSRLRRLEESDVPLRMRSGTNPGGSGHAWVYERFMPDLTTAALEHRRKTGRVFIPAKLSDNPYIDADEYRKSLSELPEIERQQLEDGLWVTDSSKRPFDVTWWTGRNRYSDADTDPGIRSIVGRYLSFDTATKLGQANSYTARVTGEITADWRLLIKDVWRDRLQVPYLADKVVQSAAASNYDGKLQSVIIEDQSSGIGIIQTLKLSNDWLARKITPFRPIGDKFQRASQAALWVKRGCVLLPQPTAAVPWLLDFENELRNFPDVEHADTVDAFSQLVLYLENILAQGWRRREGIG